MDTFNVVLVALLALAVTVVILAPWIQTGGLAMLGLIAVDFGLAAIVLREVEGTDSWIGLRGSLRAIFIGSLVVFVALAWRCGWVKKGH